MIIKKQNQKGFTLIETLVSLFIFGMMSVALVNIFVGALNSQTRILQNQDLMSQTSYVLERMGKIIRMAEKDVAGTCAPAGESYLVSGQSITFLTYDTKAAAYRCAKFSLESNTIKESRSTDTTAANLQAAQAITSSSIYVSGLSFTVTGDTLGESPALQPKTTILINARYNAVTANPPRLIIQTSISQRKLDI